MTTSSSCSSGSRRRSGSVVIRAIKEETKPKQSDSSSSPDVITQKYGLEAGLWKVPSSSSSSYLIPPIQNYRYYRFFRRLSLHPNLINSYFKLLSVGVIMSCCTVNFNVCLRNFNLAIPFVQSRKKIMAICSHKFHFKKYTLKKQDWFYNFVHILKKISVPVQIFSSKEEEEDENVDVKKSKGDQAKELLTKYGGAYLATSITLSLISFSLCYALITAGVDVQALLQKVYYQVFERKPNPHPINYITCFACKNMR